MIYFIKICDGLFSCRFTLKTLTVWKTWSFCHTGRTPSKIFEMVINGTHKPMRASAIIFESGSPRVNQYPRQKKSLPPELLLQSPMAPVVGESFCSWLPLSYLHVPCQPHQHQLADFEKRLPIHVNFIAMCQW